MSSPGPRSKCKSPSGRRQSCGPCWWKTIRSTRNWCCARCQDSFEVSADVVQDEAGFTEALHTHPPEIVLADYNLPSWKGMEALNVCAGKTWIFR